MLEEFTLRWPCKASALAAATEPGKIKHNLQHMTADCRRHTMHERVRPATSPRIETSACALLFGSILSRADSSIYLPSSTANSLSCITARSLWSLNKLPALSTSQNSVNVNLRCNKAFAATTAQTAAWIEARQKPCNTSDEGFRCRVVSHVDEVPWDCQKTHNSCG